MLFFKKVQAELKQIISTIDQICKNVVNTIGFPYICYKNNFNAYKRIKNKEYGKISTAQLYKLVNQTRNTPLLKLAQSQQRLYLKEVNNSHQMIKQIDHLLASFENVTKYYQQKTKFRHDNSEYLQNKKIVQKIRENSKTTSNVNIIKKPKINQNGQLTQRPKRIMTETSEPADKMIAVSGIYSRPNAFQTQSMPKQLKKSTPKPSISALKSQGNRTKLLNAIKTQHNQSQTNSRENKFLNTTPVNKERDRRVSIDTQLVRNRQRKLQEKASQIRKADQKIDLQNEFQQQQKSKQGINNYNLPAQEQKVKVQKPMDVEIIPVTRKLTEKLYQTQQSQQIQSPLIRNKFKANSKKSSEEQSNEKEFDKNNKTPKQQQAKKNKTKTSNSSSLKMSQTSQQPGTQLSEAQQKSFVLLTASLKLQTNKAIPILQRAIKQCSNNLSAVEYLTYLYLEASQYQKCIYLCDKYLYIIKNNKNLQKSRTLLICNKASGLNNLGRYSQTVKLLQNYSPTNDVILKNLGNAYYGLGFLDQAIQIFKKVLMQLSDDEIYYNLSGCLYLVKKYEQAKSAIQSALAFQPNKKQYLQLQIHIRESIKSANNFQ